MATFNAQSTAAQVLDGHDLTGKTVFITGGASGIGQETARAMAAKGAHVVIAARNREKMDEALAAIKSDTRSDKVETIMLDLASLDSVRACADAANQRLAKIDLLINNAGVMACPLSRTTDGFEMQFGTNHLGHFLLTSRLMPLIEKGHNKRIVILSSRAHHMAPSNLDDPNFENTDYHPWISYGQSKTANALFSVGLERRFSDKGIHAYAVHPGGIETNLSRHLTKEQSDSLIERVQTNDPDFSWKTIAQGAATSCWAATAPDIEGKGGVYCEDCHVAEVDDATHTGSVRSYALNPDYAEKLWSLSEELVGEAFAS